MWFVDWTTAVMGLVFGERYQENKGSVGWGQSESSRTIGSDPGLDNEDNLYSTFSLVLFINIVVNVFTNVGLICCSVFAHIPVAVLKSTWCKTRRSYRWIKAGWLNCFISYLTNETLKYFMQTLSSDGLLWFEMHSLHLSSFFPLLFSSFSIDVTNCTLHFIPYYEEAYTYSILYFVNAHFLII